MHQNPFLAGAPSRTSLGSLRRSPRLPNRLGRGIPLPHSSPPSTPSASRLVLRPSWTQNPGYASVNYLFVWFHFHLYKPDFVPEFFLGSSSDSLSTWPVSRFFHVLNQNDDDDDDDHISRICILGVFENPKKRDFLRFSEVVFQKKHKKRNAKISSFRIHATLYKIVDSCI